MANVYSLSGKVLKDVKLPEVFRTEFRPDLIQRAVVAIQANRRQPYGTSTGAGLQTSADYFGRRRDAYRMTINRGMSRLPREKTGGGGLGKVRRVPHSVGGRRAHPPMKKNYDKKINKKEYAYALKSAIASTANEKLMDVKISKKIGLPIIVEDSIQKLGKTKDILKAIKAIGLENLKILIVVKENGGIIGAASNIPNANATLLSELDVEKIAPGANLGRVVLWSESAIKSLGENGPA